MNEAPRTPSCIGIILDGNRRWAKEKGLPTFEGHRKGADVIEKIARAAGAMHIQHMALYIFSTENWRRTEDEISYLMQLFETLIRQHVHRLSKDGVAVRFVGQRERFSPRMQDLMDDAEKKSPHDAKLTLWVCLSYGGRAEIVAAANAAAEAGRAITEESLQEHLWTAGMPEPDLIIRTGGEKRLSNFLTWQCVYSELFFIEKYWPDFTEDDLKNIIDEYATREKRLGK